MTEHRYDIDIDIAIDIDIDFIALFVIIVLGLNSVAVCVSNVSRQNKLPAIRQHQNTKNLLVASIGVHIQARTQTAHNDMTLKSDFE